MKTLYDFPVSECIRQAIQQHNGEISFADFMELALYHPQHGYYSQDHFQIGEQGDFITAPQLSPLFAKCIARQCEQVFSHLPSKNILELGAGTGKLAYDLLLELEKNQATPTHFYIYEISKKLRKQQQNFLKTLPANLFNRIQWLDQLPQNFVGIIVLNEVLDALPFHRFCIKKNNVVERVVKWEADEFVWGESLTCTPQLIETVSQLQQQFFLPEGYESEICLGLSSFIESLSHCLIQGMILLIDYGYPQQEYYRQERHNGTFMCFHQHTKHQNPFIFPGSQDITAHVDFTSVIEIADRHGCSLAGFTTQAAFLLACGLMELAQEEEKKLVAIEQIQLRQAIKTLTLPTEMGEIIKVMALTKGNTLPPLLGFTLQDKRHEL